MREKSWSSWARTSQTLTPVLELARVLPAAFFMPPRKPKDPNERVDIREPRYALAALETLFRQCHQKPAPWKVTEPEIWHFAKFPEIWATEAIQKKSSGWKKTPTTRRRSRRWRRALSCWKANWPGCMPPLRPLNPYHYRSQKHAVMSPAP